VGGCVRGKSSEIIDEETVIWQVVLQGAGADFAAADSDAAE